jgi:hypothetical protein
LYDYNSAYIMSTGDGLGTGVVEAQTGAGTIPTGSHMMYNLPSQNPAASDQTGLFSLLSGTLTFDGTTDKGAEGYYAWDEPVNNGGGTLSYSVVEPSTGEISVTDGNQSILTCFAITPDSIHGKLACISEDSQPNIHVLSKE